MKLNAQQVHVWEINLSSSAEELHDNFLLLSEDEVKRAKRLHLSNHQRNFINSRAALRKILAHYLAVSAEEIHFDYKHRKPVLALPKKKLCFNLSHSQNQAIYAVTKDIEVGIDIEKMREVDYTGIAKRCFSPGEIRALSEGSNTEDIFYRIWSRKEAVLKRIGQTRAVSSTSFSVPTHSQGGILWLGSIRMHVLTLARFPGYAAAVATSEPIEFIQYFRLDAGFPQLVQSLQIPI